MPNSLIASRIHSVWYLQLNDRSEGRVYPRQPGDTALISEGLRLHFNIPKRRRDRLPNRDGLKSFSHSLFLTITFIYFYMWSGRLPLTLEVARFV